MADELSEEFAGDFEQDALDDFDASEDVEQQDDQPSMDLGPSDPVPVAITSRVYSAFRDAHGEGEAASLQFKWGDRALGNEAIVRGVVEDNPTLDAIFVEHQAENGGVSLEGVRSAAEYLAQQSGLDGIDALIMRHPELNAVFLDHFDESTGTLSMTGVYRALHYIGKKSEYRHTYRAKR